MRKNEGSVSETSDANHWWPGNTKRSDKYSLFLTLESQAGGNILSHIVRIINNFEQKTALKMLFFLLFSAQKRPFFFRIVSKIFPLLDAQVTDDNDQ